MLEILSYTAERGCHGNTVKTATELTIEIYQKSSVSDFPSLSLKSTFSLFTIRIWYLHHHISWFLIWFLSIISLCCFLGSS
ncbi:hypothetical protein MKW98_008124 [Papaver atlanticum]|uniref:Uncharacterized protein n=1 Tax=Papaver atlanticum TaxID=357466 RepID=A0AAD4S7P4_9MAGN|nr:hypothetical protein MKW98_008124 [Papaver atlanticum]